MTHDANPNTLDLSYARELLERQEDTAKRLRDRDKTAHTGGADWLVGLERRFGTNPSSWSTAALVRGGSRT